MKKTVLLYFLLFVNIVFSQNNTIESLNSELKIATTDTVKIKILRKLGVQLTSSNPDKALVYLNEALALSIKINDDNQIISSYNRLGWTYRHLGNFTEAIKIYKEALRISEKINSQTMIAACYGNLSSVTEDMGNFPLALNYGLMAIKMYEKANDTKGMANMHTNLGTLYFDKKDLVSALKNFKEAYKLYAKLKDSVTIVIVLDNLSSVYLEQKNYELGLSNALEALHIREILKDTVGKSHSYLSIANAYYIKKNYPSAIKNFLEAINLSAQTKDKYFTAHCYFGLASTYYEAKDYNNALINTNNGQRIATEIQSPNEILFGYYLFSDIYEKKQDYKKAFEYQKLYNNLNDSIFNADKNKQIVEMQTKYETTKKEEEISKLTQQSQILTQQNQIQQLQLSRNWYLILGLGSFVLLVLIVAFLLAQQNKLKANQTKMEVEQKLFRSQMNPHFIFNSLIAIQNYVYKHEPAEVAKYISSFAKLMRMILENSRNEYVTIEKELDTLKYYLELQQLRFQDKFDFSIEVDPNIDVEAVSIPPMLSQPFIENAIEHGIMNKPDGKGNIVLKFIQKDKMIEMIVEDNGIGIENAAKLKAQHEKKHTSLATTITEERLAILNKKSKQKFSLKITDLKNEKGLSRGTQVCITMPEA